MLERKAQEARVWFNKSFSSLEPPLATLRAAWRDPKSLRILVSHSRGGCGAFLHADECFTEPTALPAEKYADWCLTQCRERRVDVFVPARHMAELAARTEDFAVAGTRLLVAAAPETLHLLHDKALCHEALQGILPLPETYLVTSLAKFREAVLMVQNAGHRPCFKPVSGAGGVGFNVLNEHATMRKRLLEGWMNATTLTEAEQALSQGASFPKLVVMEHLPGVEYSVDALAWRGKLRLALARRKQGQVQVIDRHPELEEHLRALSAHFCLSGLFNAQFRTSKEGVLKFLEINPRMSGGIGHTEATGVHLLALALELCLRDGVETRTMPTPRLPMTVLPCHRSLPVPSGAIDANAASNSKEDSFA